MKPTFVDGMFAILVPVSLAPLIGTLLWAERKAKRMGLVDNTSRPALETRLEDIHPSGPYGACCGDRRLKKKKGAGWLKISRHGEGFVAKALRTSEQLDVLGLVLLGA